MRIRTEIQGRNIEVTEAVAEYVERRLSFSLERFAHRIELVRVRLTDLNGPRGGVDQQCRLHVLLHGSGDVFIEDSEEDLYVAIDRAAERASRAVSRKLDRERHFEAEALRSMVS